MTLETHSTFQYYASRRDRAHALLEPLLPRSRRVSGYRFVVFVAGIALFPVYAWGNLLSFGAAVIVGLLLLLGFSVLVVWHRRIFAAIERETREETICTEGMNRILRDWKALAPLPDPPIADPSGVAADLDLFGATSLYRLTGGAVTRLGQETLARWLLAPSSPSESASRSAFVEELCRERDLLMEMQHLTRKMERDALDPGPFVAWAKGKPWLDAHRGILWSARLLSPLPLLFGLGAAFGLLPSPLWMAAVAVNLIFSSLFARPVHRIFDAVSMHKGRIDQYSSLLEFIAACELKAPRGRAVKQALETDGVTAWRQMKSLERIAELADMRFSAMTHFPVQMFTLLDFHTLAWMETWQKRVGAHTERWLEALGEFEAFIALALLAHDNPDYTTPTILPAEETPTFSVEGLGHPLLPPDRSITNDVTLGPPGTFLLVTGSNMSGKSSLLRSIGLNIALAGAGGPVAAKTLEMTPFTLGTSFRVTDSIGDGISFFMAELKRLKQIATRAESTAKGEPPLLFLLDEILQGTNIIERRVAVTGILNHLVGLGCLGAISSHDLTLAEADDLGDKAKTVYFTEQFRDGEAGREMYFDYTLRDGVAPTTNALELLRLVGLDFHT